MYTTITYCERLDELGINMEVSQIVGQRPRSSQGQLLPSHWCVTKADITCIKWNTMHIRRS